MLRHNPISMTTSSPPDDLLDPQFLSFFDWLAQYIGIWQYGSGRFQVRRGPAGWIQAIAEDGPRATLEDVLSSGTLVELSTAPLGPRPVILSISLMHSWLDANQFHRLRHAMHTAPGRREILHAVEAAMLAAGPTAMRAYWHREWTSAIIAGSIIPKIDNGVVERLWREFQQTVA
jgi:hypothetical protein